MRRGRSRRRVAGPRQAARLCYDYGVGWETRERVALLWGGGWESSGAVSDNGSVLLSDDAPIVELEELRPLITDGHERGFLTFEEIAACLEEIEVTKEQIQELHLYLDEQGIDVVEADGRPAKSDAGGVEASAENAAESNGHQRKKVEVDLTVEPSLDSLRLYLRSIGRVDLLTAEQEVQLARRIERGDML